MKKQLLNEEKKLILKKIMQILIYSYVIYYVVSALVLAVGTMLNMDILENSFMIIIYSIFIFITGILFISKCFKMELLFLFMFMVQVLF